MLVFYLDRDNDDILTEDEFAQLKVGDNGEVLLSQGEKERREEFRTLVDTNADGKADRKELIVSVDRFLIINALIVK